VATYKDTYALTYFAFNLQGAARMLPQTMKKKQTHRRFDNPTLPHKSTGVATLYHFVNTPLSYSSPSQTIPF